MMNHLKTSLAIGLVWLLASGCASEVDPAIGAPAADPHAVLQGTGLEGIETTSGVTDIEAGLELSSGSTDEAFAGISTTPRPNTSLHRSAPAASTTISTPSSTGAGVSHGSPQPLDPKPTDTAAQSSATK